jgi:hypothetical protein
MAVIRALVMLAVVGALAAPVGAQAPQTTSELLRAGNAAALAGDWQSVAQLVTPLLSRPLASPDRAETHRLAGIAAFYQDRRDDAERHFVAYLRIDLDGRLDPALYPPDVVAFCNDVASRHAAELRALRARPRRSWLKTLVPPLGQFQNGQRTKGYVLGGVLGGLVVFNLTTYAYLRSWCDHTDGPGGGALTCKDGPGGRDRTDEAKELRPYNFASGIAVIAVYVFGVYDGVKGYRRRTRELALQPFVVTSPERSLLGVAGSF